MTTVILLLLVLLFVLVNGYFVAAEFAVVRTRASRMQHLADEGDRLEPMTRQILEKAMRRLHHQVQRVTRITHSLLGFVRAPEAGMQ